jgi:hypothetical protein
VTITGLRLYAPYQLADQFPRQFPGTNQVAIFRDRRDILPFWQEMNRHLKLFWASATEVSST